MNTYTNFTYKYAPVYNIDYRGVHLDFYLEESTQQIFTVWPGTEEIISFGSYDADFAEKAKHLIDQSLDIIAGSHKLTYPESCLEWFDNAGHRDIKLSYQGRVLKIFLVAIESEINQDQLINDSIKILKKVVK